MESASRSRPTAAAADVEENCRLRRFLDPPPWQPHGHGDVNTSGVDAALLTRRQELLLEMHKGFMHQGMIWRELMETECAMGLTVGGYKCNPVSAIPWSQDYLRRWMPSVPSWEAPLRQPWPCGHGSSPAVKAPPVYPHMELSLRAPEQTRPGNDAMQHQEGMPSGARIHPFDSPLAAKDGINQMQPSSGHQQAIVGEKIGVEDVQNIQPSHEIKNLKEVQPTTEGTSAGVKRKLTAPSSPVKKQMSALQDLKEEEEVPENRWMCTLCQANCTCEADYLSHLGGRRHRKKLYCRVCDVQCNSEKMLASHLGGRKHRATLAGSDSD